MMEDRTPHLSKSDRLMGVIRSLSISDRAQLNTITKYFGWTEMMVEGALQRIRKMGQTKEERDKWLISWQPRWRSPFVYTLGEKGIDYIKGIKDEPRTGSDYYITRGQVFHFMGTNEILCRAMRTGLIINGWLSSREVIQQLYFTLIERKIQNGIVVANESKSPLQPDAVIIIDGVPYFIEFDTGSESPFRIEDKMHKYLTLDSLIGPIYPVIWVTITPERKAAIERAGIRAMDKYNLNENPAMYAFVAGEETKFFAGESFQPFWEEKRRGYKAM